MVIADRDDRVFPPECQRELAAGIPHARLHLVDHAGHNPHAEQAAEVMAAIRHFISADPGDLTACPAAEAPLGDEVLQHGLM